MPQVIKKRFPLVLSLVAISAIVCMVGYSVYPSLTAEASTAANITVNNVAAADFAQGENEKLVLDITLPDAWNGLDPDNVYTTGTDTLVDADGSSTVGVGDINVVSGSSITSMGNDIAAGALAVCTDSLASPTIVRIDTDGDCADGTAGTYVLGAGAATVEVTSAWSFHDVSFSGTYDDGEDILIDFTAATVKVKNGSGDFWNGGSLQMIMGLFAAGSVGYKDDGTTGFQGTETVVKDLDGDQVYTALADTLIDGDGSSTTAAGSADASAGATLTVMGDDIADGVAICTNSLLSPTSVRIDTDGNCADGSAGTYILGAAAATVEVDSTWVFADADSSTHYDDGEDIFIESVASELTYSATADTDLYSGGGLSAGDALTAFPMDCNGDAAGTLSCKSASDPGVFDSTTDIYIADGGATIKRRDDQLIGIGIKNDGTAVDTTDIEAIHFWMDQGVAGFQGTGTDMDLGAMTVSSVNTKEWRLGGLTSSIINGGRRFFVTVDIAAGATVDRTLKFTVPLQVDTSANGIVSEDGDVGVFVSSTNDGPSDGDATNTNTQTIIAGGVPSTPTVANITTTKADNAGGAGVANATDVITVTWDAATDGYTDVVSGKANFADFGAEALVNLRDDGAGCDGTGIDDIWCASYTVVAGPVFVDDTDNDVVLTQVTNDGALVADDVTDDTQISVDNIAPDITGNGTLTISTPANGVADVAALNDGATNQDKVTTTVVTLTAADTDTMTIDLTALTGQAALSLGTESTVVLPGVLDSDTQTFTITVTDNAGNTDTIASDEIKVDNVAPVITVPGTIAITTEVVDDDVVAIGDTVTPGAATLNILDGSTQTVNLTTLTGQAALATGSASVAAISGTLDAATQFVYTVTDNGGNITTGNSVALSVDNQPPTVTAAKITTTGATGTDSIFKNADVAVPTWNNTAGGDNNSDVVSVSFDASHFRSVDVALAGVNAASTWTATLTGALDSQDDINNNVSVTVTDNAGNVTTTEDTGNYVIDSIVPVFGTEVGPLQALKQDGANPNSVVNSWYYYNDASADQMRMVIWNTLESDGLALSGVRVCIKSLVTDTPAATCSAEDFTNAAYYTTASADTATTKTLNYNLGSLETWPTEVGGYSVNFRLEDNAGNFAYTSGASQTFVAVLNVDPKTLDATLNNASTTDWKTITDFTNITGSGDCPGADCLVFNAQGVGGDVARIIFTGTINLTASATITALQSFATHVTATGSTVRINSTALAALDTSATVMMKMTTAVRPGLHAQDNTGTHLAYIPNNQVAAVDLGAYGTISNFVWDGDGKTLTYDVSGFSEYDADNTPPEISAVREFDLDNDGSIDETMLTFTEAIDDSTVTAANFTIGGTAANTIMAANSTNGVDTNTADDSVITIKVALGVSGTGKKAIVYTAGTLTDLYNNALATVTFAADGVTDSAEPIITSATYRDPDTDGVVNMMYVEMSEVVQWNGSDKNQFNVTANDLTGFSGTGNDWGGNNTATVIINDFDNATTDLTGVGAAGTQPTIVYTRSATPANRIKDATGNDLRNYSASLGDAAAPIVLSVSPLSGALNVESNTSVVYNFSEPMTETMVHATQFTCSPNPAGWAAVWSNSGKRVTLAHTDFDSEVVYTVTTSHGSIEADSGTATGLTAYAEWSFTSISYGRHGGSGGGSSGTPLVTFSINSGAVETVSSSVNLNISATNATEMLIGNDTNFVGSQWETFSATKVWTLPGGLGDKTIYVAVRDASQNSSTTYSRTIKVVEKTSETTIDVNASTLKIDKSIAKSDGLEKVTATVAVKLNTGVVASGKTVTLSSSRIIEDKITAINALTDSSGLAVFEISSTVAGVSTLLATVDGYSIVETAAMQFVAPSTTDEASDDVELIAVNVGDLIKSSSVSSAVYYYGADGKRHAFATITIFNTYYTDFSDVKEISAAQMAGIGLGSNAKVRPGTWMVKIQSDPKVYAVTPSGILRWVKTEDIAKDLYGATWNKKIIDIEAGFFQDYVIGEPIETSSHPSASLIQYENDSTAYYIINSVKRKIMDTAVFNANRFQNRFKQVISILLTYIDGSDITGKEDSISEVVY